MEGKVRKAWVVAAAVVTVCLSCITAPTPMLVPVETKVGEHIERKLLPFQEGDEEDVTIKIGEMRQAYVDSMALECAIEVANAAIDGRQAVAMRHEELRKWAETVPFRSMVVGFEWGVAGALVGMIGGFILGR